MALKDVLVIVDDAPQVDRIIGVAADICVEYDAHLGGLYIAAPLSLPGSLETFLGDELRAACQVEEDARAARAGARFAAGAAATGRLDRSDWRVVTGVAADVAAEQGRTADLVICGQVDPAGVPGFSVVEPETLVFECGRPVLVVPYVGRFPTVGRRVLVAWNGSREAARALHDALPLLARAQLVTVLAVCAPGAAGDPAASAVRHLARHGIAATVSHVVTEPKEVGDVLLNTAADLSCDLIVMGAYGRSRLRSLVLGSLTGFMLQHMTVPVLFSH